MAKTHACIWHGAENLDDGPGVIVQDAGSDIRVRKTHRCRLPRMLSIPHIGGSLFLCGLNMFGFYGPVVAKYERER